MSAAKYKPTRAMVCTYKSAEPKRIDGWSVEFLPGVRLLRDSWRKMWWSHYGFHNNTGPFHRKIDAKMWYIRGDR